MQLREGMLSVFLKDSKPQMVTFFNVPGTGQEGTPIREYLDLGSYRDTITLPEDDATYRSVRSSPKTKNKSQSLGNTMTE